MHIAFRFHYNHNNALFARLLESVAESSSLQTTLYKENDQYLLAASGEQDELERLAELVSKSVPQSLFLLSHSIEEIKSIDESKSLAEEKSSYEVPYCNACQENIRQTLNPFIACKVCGNTEVVLSFETLAAFVATDTKNVELLFESFADMLLRGEVLRLPTYSGTRNFSLLSTQEKEEYGILVCDPSDISTSFVITQDELNTLMMIEKPSLRLKPKIKLRAEYELEKSFYPVFFADDKITLALSLALLRKGVFALYCDNVTSLRAASALGEHVIVNVGRDMLPWQYPMKLDQAASCEFDGFKAYGDSRGLVLSTDIKPTLPSIRFIPNQDFSATSKGIPFEPSHAALRSIVLEHSLQGRSLCGVYLSRQHDSALCSFSPKIGYTSMTDFSSFACSDEPRAMLESIAQMDDEGKRLVANYKKSYPQLYDAIEKASFDTDTTASMLSRTWAMAALFMGLTKGGDISRACEELEATALEFNGKSGPRIDYKVIKSDKGYEFDPRLAIRSAISFKLAGVDDYLLSFGFIDSLADFIAQQAEMADANIAIEGVALSGSLFENRQLLMRTYNALSKNYTVYRNRRLALDGANVAIGAITLGSE